MEYLYDTSQAAKELGISQIYVRKLCEWGTIKATKTSANGHWRIPSRELLRYKLARYRKVMGDTDFVPSKQNVVLHLTAADLKEFAHDIANEVREQAINGGSRGGEVF